MKQFARLVRERDLDAARLGKRVGTVRVLPAKHAGPRDLPLALGRCGEEPHGPVLLLAMQTPRFAREEPAGDAHVAQARHGAVARGAPREEVDHVHHRERRLGEGGTVVEEPAVPLGVEDDLSRPGASAGRPGTIRMPRFVDS